MPPFNSAPRALARLVAHRKPLRQRARGFPTRNQIRRPCSIAGNNAFSSVETGGYRNRDVLGCANSSHVSGVLIQRRGFLGCGDGEEGGMLSKVHEERRVLG